MAGPVDARDYPTVKSLGTMTRQGYVYATWPQAEGVTSLADVKGLQIDVGPKGSFTANFAKEVLAEFGVTPENSDFVYLASDAPQEEAIAAGVDVTIARLPERREYVRQGLASGDMTMIPIPQAKTLQARIASAELVDVPYAAFSLDPPRPTNAIPTLGQLVTVVADDRLSPAAVYAMAQEMVIQFSRGNEWREPGEFPNFSDRQLPASQEAAEFYASGAIPWQYQNLPSLLADSFSSLLVLGALLLVIGSIYQVFLPDHLPNVIRPRSEEKYLTAIEAVIAEGGAMTPRDARRLSRILAQRDADRVLSERAERLRPHLSSPLDDRG